MRLICAIHYRLLNLVETGIVKYMLLENLPHAEICPQNLGSQERQLRNGDLWMTYQIMMGGFGTGFIIFITEVGSVSHIIYYIETIYNIICINPDNLQTADQLLATSQGHRLR